MEMGHDHQYGLPDLRQLMAGRTHFPANPQATEPYFVQKNMLSPLAHHESIMFPAGCGGLMVRFGDDHFTNITNGGLEMESITSGWTTVGINNNDGGGNNNRWPRQETLTLLEIRSRLHSKFKEANQKGPLWDELSRIMAEEHGYHRSGKKCREKFENLYKYYKKTKEGKAGRQDGKNYRFFRQLEALYGDQTSCNQQASLLSQTNLAQSNNATNQEFLQDQSKMMISSTDQSLSFSNTSHEFETSSSTENNDRDDLSAIAFLMNNSIMDHQKKEKRVRTSRGCKEKVKEIVESQVSKLVETQEIWMERMLKTIEDREKERLSKEEEWRKLQEAARLNQEREFWAKERAYVEARDSALMEVLNKFTGKQNPAHNHKNYKDNYNEAMINSSTNRWTEPEVSSLLDLKTSLESLPRFQEIGYSKGGLWEEIEAKMVCLGYDRSAVECKEKWENMQIYSFDITTDQCNKKRKEDLRSNRGSYNFDQQPESYSGQQEIIIGKQSLNDQNMDSPVGNQVHGACFHILTTNEGGDHLWDKYGKGKNQQL